MASQVFNLMATLGINTASYEAGLKKAGGQADTFAGKIGKGIGTAAKIGIAAVGALASAAVALGVQAVKTGMDFDAAMSQVSATLGYSTDDIKENINGAGESFEKLRAKAEEAGRSTVFSATQAAEGLNILAMSGYSADQSIAMLDDVLHLAAAGNMDMASAAAYVSGTMKGFNDETKSAAYYADLMAKGATKANTSVQQLGEAMSDGAATAKAYNQSADSMTLSLLRLAEQGEVGSAAGTALAAAMKDIYTPSEQAKKALSALGVAAYDETGAARDFNVVINELTESMAGMTDEEKASYTQTIFGIQGLRAYNKMAVTSIEKQNEFADALSNSTGEAAKQYATMTDNLKGDIAAWNSAFDGFKITLSDKVTPTVREFVQTATEGMGKIEEAFKSGNLSQVGEVLSDILRDFTEKITKTIPTIITLAVEALRGIAGAILANADVIIQAALDIAGMLFTQILSAIPRLVKSAATILANNVGPFLKAVGDIIVELAANIGTIIKPLIEAIPTVIKAVLKGIVENLPAIVGGVMDLVTGILESLPDIITAITDALLSEESVAIMVEATSKIIESIVSHLPQLIGGLFKGLWGGLTGLFKPISDRITNLAYQLMDLPENIAKDKAEAAERVPESGYAYSYRTNERGETYKIILTMDGKAFAEGSLPYLLAEQNRTGKVIANPQA